MQIPRTYRDMVVWDCEHKEARMCDVYTDENGIISDVKPAGEKSSSPDGLAYNGYGRTALLPGFVNAHGHAAMTMVRGLGEDLPLMEWLEKRIWPIENKLNARLVRAGTMLAIKEMLSTGTTCFADMYFFMDAAAEAVLSAEIRAGLCRGITEDGAGKKKLEENIKLAKDYNGAKGLVNVQLGPHAPYTVPFDLMRDVAAAACENDLGVQLHWLETKTDWSISSSAKDMSPEEFLEKTGLTSVKQLLLAHGVWIEKEKFPFYARRNVTVAHNPKSNLKLGSGTASVAAMRKAGINIALGTDGAASNNRLDMWEEMRFAALLQKGLRNDPTLIPTNEALRMATYEGARALGFEKSGLIKPGFAADFTIIDLDKPHYVGWTLENLPGYIVYAGSSADVVSTVVAGKTLYLNGELLWLDDKKITAEAKEARKTLLKA